MGYSSTKLDVYLDRSFLTSFFNSTRDNYFSQTLKNCLLDSDECNVMDLNGNLFNSKDLKTIIGSLREIKNNQLKPSQFIISIKKRLLSALNSPSVFLIQEPSNINNQYCNNYGFLFLNSDNINNGLKSLCFNDNKNFRPELKITIDDTSKPFEYAHLADYKMPSNCFTINDQYILSWTEETFKINIFGLLENILLSNKQNYKPHVRIITRAKNNSLQIDNENTGKVNYSMEVEKKISRFVEILKLKLNKRVSFEFIVLNEYLIDSRFCKENKITIQINQSIRPEIISIQKALHDRIFYTNYISGAPRNSFDFIKKNKHGTIERKITALALSSFLDKNNLKDVVQYNNTIEVCLKLKEDLRYSNYFTYRSNIIS
ncbi:MAG: hypothetical protein IPP32_16650 [Bacteroidetes bacterium]|nr:hypothetical protein [Bacteroidota bacterium]